MVGSNRGSMNRGPCMAQFHREQYAPPGQEKGRQESQVQSLKQAL